MRGQFSPSFLFLQKDVPIKCVLVIKDYVLIRSGMFIFCVKIKLSGLSFYIVFNEWPRYG